MSKSIQKNPFEEKARAMAGGFRAFPLANTQLVFRGETLFPGQAAARFQGMLDSFASVRDAEAAHRGALQTHEKSLADFQSFYEDAVVVVKSHFGSDPKRLGTFGLGPAKRPRRASGRPIDSARGEVVIEEVIVERAPVEPVVEVREEVEVPSRGRGDEVDVDAEVSVGGRGGERVEVETRVHEPSRRSPPHRGMRRPHRGTRRPHRGTRR